MNKDILGRINELARKKKAKGLTPDEYAEQQRLYKDYIKFIRGQVISQLDQAGYSRTGTDVNHSNCGHQECKDIH